MIRGLGKIQLFHAVGGIVENADDGAVPFAQEAAGFRIREGQGGIGSPGDFRIGLPQGDQLPVTVQEASMQTKFLSRLVQIQLAAATWNLTACSPIMFQIQKTKRL